MKYSIVFSLLMISCNGEPLTAPAAPQTIWIDINTNSDTIITNVNNQQVVIYYAGKNWQIAANPDLSHGYRFVAIRFGDSIMVKPLGDNSTNFTGPYFVAANAKNDTLKAQNFLDSNYTTPAKIYVLLHP